MVRLIALGVVAVLLASCAGFANVTGKRESIGRYSVMASGPWNASKNIEPTTWTKHGLVIDRVQFYSGVDDGDKLFERRGRDDEPVYRSTMDAFAVTEMVKSGMQTDGFEQIEINGLAPADFGGREGFSFQLTALTQSGLRVNGLVHGTNADGKLDMLVFVAPSTHYYEATVPEIDAMVASIQY